MSEKAFEIKVAGRELSLNARNCISVMFRKHCEVDYLAVDISEEEGEGSVLRIFNNEQLVRWMAGIAVNNGGYELTTADGEAFVDEYGWNSTLIIKQEPTETEQEYWLDVQSRDIDQEWQGFDEL